MTAIAATTSVATSTIEVPIPIHGASVALGRVVCREPKPPYLGATTAADTASLLHFRV